MVSHTLGFDASTQSLSAIVIDSEAGRTVAEASVNFGERLPDYGAPQGFIPGGKDGEVHADPLMWVDALELVLADLSEVCDLSKIRSVSGAGQQHGSVYLNEHWGDALKQLSPEKTLREHIEPCLSRASSPIWMDVSTTSACREIAAGVGGDAIVCAKSGSIAIERFTGPQIRRFYQTDAAGYERTGRIHLVSSFICSLLCGADAPIDTGDGAGMNLLNLSTLNWDEELLAATAPDLGARLPGVVEGRSVVGELCPFFVEKYGFKPGTPVAVFSGDNPSSLIGMGAGEAGKVVISLGTSDTFFAAMPGSLSDPTGCGHLFGNPAGGIMSLQCFVNGSLAREAVKDRFNLDWDGFTAALEATPPGNRGNLMVPFFRPEISPRMGIEAPLLRGDEGFINWQDSAAAVRACVEGQFMNMKLRTEWMGLSPKVIFLTGGASRNDAIAQVVADIFQTEVKRLAVTGSVALGAAMRAADATGAVSLGELEDRFCQPVANSALQPDPAAADTYRELSQAFELLLKQAL